ncbi:hypothetical protein J6590_058578 [Homalodisca vitripennis]|nr:hypothetical protein J6590_058578 [Homalodisca vitripennis]
MHEQKSTRASTRPSPTNGIPLTRPYPSSNILLWEMTVGVGGVCSLTSEVLTSLNKGVPPLTYFDWKGWFRAGLPFFRGDMTRCSALVLPRGSR